ncbi:hypothetical protein P43SY_001855 [Pythium insidiosum]|uniref:phosphoglycerate kinase n=1 Tax=Pythium insidiosum TaxID=114742 RepID=A0AAD5Q642_PYTIN|nr:hypothetical protein P43SY_001855 [Pythium insidiosum]
MQASSSSQSLGAKPSTASSATGKKTRTVLVARNVTESPSVVSPASPSARAAPGAQLPRDAKTGKLSSYAALGNEQDVEQFEKFLQERKSRASGASDRSGGSHSPQFLRASTKRRTMGQINVSPPSSPMPASNNNSANSPGRGGDAGQAQDPVHAQLLLEAEKDARKRREALIKHRKWLKSLPIHERLAFERQQNVLAKWKQINADWERFKARTSKRLGKSEKQLVMSRASEYREQMEMYDALQRALPLSEKVGGDIWLVSLRNDGTRYVPVGNIFSGLFCPIRESSKIQPRVRRPLDYADGAEKPHLSTLEKRSLEALERKKRRLRKQLEVLFPHEVEASQGGKLKVETLDLFEWAARSHAEAQLSADDGDTWTSISTIEGLILPNEIIGFEFTFQSERAGMFLERWLLDVDPPLQTAAPERRFSMQLLDNSLIEQALLPTIASLATTFAVEQIVKTDLIGAVNPVYPVVFPELTGEEATAFEEAHRGGEFDKIQYSSELIEQSKELYAKARAVAQPEEEIVTELEHPLQTQDPNGSLDGEQAPPDPPLEGRFPRAWDCKMETLRAVAQAADAKQLESYSAIKAVMAKEAEQDDEEEDEPDWTGAKARKKEAQLAALDAAYPSFVTTFRAICLAAQISPRDSSFLTDTLYSGLSRMCGETPVVHEIAKHIQSSKPEAFEEALRRLSPLLVRALDEAIGSDQERELVFEEARRAQRGVDLAKKQSFRHLASLHDRTQPLVVFLQVDLDISNWFSLVSPPQSHVDAQGSQSPSLAWKLSERLVEHETYVPPKVATVAHTIHRILEVVEASGGIPWIVLLSELSTPPMTKAAKKLETSVVAGVLGAAAAANDSGPPKDERIVRQQLIATRDSSLSFRGVDLVLARALDSPSVEVQFAESLSTLEDAIAQAKPHGEPSDAPTETRMGPRVLLSEHIGVAILGGKDVERKLRLIDGIIERVSAIYFVGEIAMTLLRVMYAFHKAYRKNVALLVPVEFVVGDVPLNELGIDGAATSGADEEEDDDDGNAGEESDDDDDDEESTEARRMKRRAMMRKAPLDEPCGVDTSTNRPAV